MLSELTDQTENYFSKPKLEGWPSLRMKGRNSFQQKK